MTVKDEEYSKEGEIYKEVFKNEKHSEEKNTITIAGRRMEIYTQTILNKLQKFDQIEISVQDNYLDDAIYIIRQWEAVGVVPESEFKTKGGGIKFFKSEEDIITRDGKKLKKPVNRITLTKQPEQFRFTEKKVLK